MTDIDIDFTDRTVALDLLQHIAASNVMSGKFCRHSSGVYFQRVPVDPLTGTAAIPYDEAAALGYFKFDFINNSIYDGVVDEAHLDALIARDPPWELLELPDIVDELAHIREHFPVVKWLKPRSVEDLAVALALIRPGKSHLVGENRATIEEEVWRPGDGYSFKKSHAVSYAVSIVVQLNLLVEKIAAVLDNETT